MASRSENPQTGEYETRFTDGTIFYLPEMQAAERVMNDPDVQKACHWGGEQLTDTLTHELIAVSLNANREKMCRFLEIILESQRHVPVEETVWTAPGK